MITLVTTPGAVNANSYATLAYAVAYVATLTFAKGWPTTEEAQKALLVQGARRMETLALKGTRSSPKASQALAFPRWGIYDRDHWLIDSTVVPTDVMDAQVELAIWLGLKNRNVDAAPARLKLGTLEIEGQSAQDFPDHVLAILAPYLKSSGNNITLERA